MREPTHTALGSWSGGRYMHFGEQLDEDRLVALLRPDDAIRTVITADVYGAGGADAMVGRALEGCDRDAYCLVGAIGHDFYEGERDGAKGFPRFTDARLRGPGEYAGYLRMAAERSLERVGVDSFDLLLLHNPDRTGYTDPAVWEGMVALRDAGLAGSLGIAPGPANGFTLDVIDCLERFGDVIDWAMVILNPLEPWPGELVLRAAREHDVRLITRVVDYGGLFHGDLRSAAQLGPSDHRAFRPQGWIDQGRARIDAIAPIAQRHGLTLLQLACAWNLAHEPVRCVVPTLVQEPGGRPVEEQRADLAAVPAGPVLSDAEVARIREIGDNVNCMALKGGVPGHEGEPRPDSWALDEPLAAVAGRWGIDPERDLTYVH